MSKTASLFRRLGFHTGLWACVVFLAALSREVSGEESGLKLRKSSSAPGAPTLVDYSVKITGEISTPDANGPRKFPLSSVAEFQFEQAQDVSDDPLPLSLRAMRKFRTAEATTVVGEDHKTDVRLSKFYRTIHVYGGSQGLQFVSPRYQLPRRQLDLLQMPFDVLAAGGLLTGSSVDVGDKWNTESWVVPMLTGLDAVIEQQATCTLESATAGVMTVAFSGEVSGAVQGSASEIEFSGTLKIDQASGRLLELAATQKEQRSPGPVSPGLDVTATIAWKQKSVESSEIAEKKMPAVAPKSNLLVLLQTPLKLQLKHSREWYLFHETPSVLMIRQLRDGNLLAQCNISSSVTVPPGEHTPDQEFLADVGSSVEERKGSVVSDSTTRDDDKWRIRRVRAVGNADGKAIAWDYYLCTAVTGEQYSIVFSYSKADEMAVLAESDKLLSTLQVVRRRLPALPYR